MPFAVERLAPGSVLVDLVYAPDPTPLSGAARAVGAIVVEGREVLQTQANRQFQKMTGQPMPAGLTAELLGLADVLPAEAG
jgi:shikimate dehydrogenase